MAWTSRGTYLFLILSVPKKASSSTSNIGSHPLFGAFPHGQGPCSRRDRKRRDFESAGYFEDWILITLCDFCMETMDDAESMSASCCKATKAAPLYPSSRRSAYLCYFSISTSYNSLAEFSGAEIISVWLSATLLVPRR